MQEIENRLEQILRDELRLELKAVPCGPDLGGGPVGLRCYRVRQAATSLELVVQIRRGPLREIADLAREAHRVQREDSDRVFVLAAPQLTGRARRMLEERGINYLDLAGHARIQARGFFVHVRPGESRRPALPRQGPGPNPFAKKASLIPRAILEHPERSWGVRELHRETELSVGYVSDVLAEMERLAYLARQGDAYRLAAPERLLAAWLEAYRWDRNEIFSFRAPFEKAELASGLAELLEDRGINYAFTLLFASDQVAPHVVHDQVHVYLEYEDRFATPTLVQSNFHAEPVSRGGNLHLLVPYYRATVFYGARMVGALRVVSDVQLFLDLARYPLRGEEAAGALLRKVLRPKLGLSGEQVQRLLDLIELT